ncbi:MAG: hypothetical protein KatS3mg089_0594 [Patescibacteria group bacterium]|nr:MAG: hypothetical protein KatS3mg089_0594 [Patescibacteria group bacterium]
MINQSTPLIRQFVALIKIKPFDNSLVFVEKLADNIIYDLDLKVVKKVSYIFKPTGITLVYILSQSHLVIPTYPEIGFVNLDLSICVNRTKKEFESSLKHIFIKQKGCSIEVKTVNFD